MGCWNELNFDEYAIDAVLVLWSLRSLRYTMYAT